MAGCTLIRTDFFWPAVEPRKGHYDWSLYDDAALALRARNLRPVFILGYDNPDAYSGIWKDGISLPDEIAAFANFAAASMALAQATIAALRSADPEVVEDSYDAVRALLDRYPVQGRKLPILATESGFTVDRHISEDLQADLLVRSFRVNLSLGIPRVRFPSGFWR